MPCIAMHAQFGDRDVVAADQFLGRGGRNSPWPKILRRGRRGRPKKDRARIWRRISALSSIESSARRAVFSSCFTTSESRYTT